MNICHCYEKISVPMCSVYIIPIHTGHFHVRPFIPLSPTALHAPEVWPWHGERAIDLRYEADDLGGHPGQLKGGRFPMCQQKPKNLI